MLSIVRKTSIILLAAFILSIPFPVHPLFAVDPPMPSVGEMVIITPPEGYVMNQVSAVNSKGEVVGIVGRLSEDGVIAEMVAFFWSATEGMELIYPSEKDVTFATDINDAGEVVGFMADMVYYPEEPWPFFENSRAFHWRKDEGIRDLSDVLGDFESSAEAINNQGHITGYRIMDYGQMAFLLKEDVLIELGTLGGEFMDWGVSYSMDINIQDQIVGVSLTEEYETHAFLWEDMLMKDIGVCPGKEVSWATAINDKEEVIGICGNFRCEEFWCYVEDCSSFLYTEAEGMIDLGTLPGKSNAEPYGINSSSQVVGACYNNINEGELIPENAAFIWTRETGMKDFGEMIGVSDIFSAYDINDSGQVIGMGFTPEFGMYAFLWTPQQIEVEIDIKPGSEPNSINNNGHGVIPVAILGSPDYDIHDIDPASLRLEEVMEIKRSGKKGKLMVHFEDVDLDGKDDLVAQFLNIEGAFPKDATTATLTGYLYDGTPIKGTDSIRIIH